MKSGKSSLFQVMVFSSSGFPTTVQERVASSFALTITPSLIRIIEEGSGILLKFQILVSSKCVQTYIEQIC